MLVLLVAVGQMAQTIYIPAIADGYLAERPRRGRAERNGGPFADLHGVFSALFMARCLTTRRNTSGDPHRDVYLYAGDAGRYHHSQPDGADYRQRHPGIGTGVGGVMARTLPRDLYEGAQLRHASSLLNMGILVSPLLAPLIGGILNTLWSWRACYAFLLLILCAGVDLFGMARWMPETRPAGAPRSRLATSYKTLFGNTAFSCYLLMLIGGLAGIAVFEACSGVLMGAVLGKGMAVSILFILPIPAAFRCLVCRTPA